MNENTVRFAVLGMSLAIALPVAAQPGDFRALTLDDKTTAGVMMGSTGGTTSLPAIVGNSDRANRTCLGFGDPAPDHTLILKKAVSDLSIRVNSGGGDTTLLISGPDGVRCANAGQPGKDVKLQEDNWQPGTYQIWVGTVIPNTNRDYRLSVRAK
ncbi:MAG TPA: hypothetical protein VL134_01730 [Leptolyngbya sp.]|nr:hypothetical protein [Leptolyngbya sp.]